MQNESLIDAIQQYDSKALPIGSEDKETYYISKRIVDLILAFILLVVLLPLMLLTAVVILVYSPGPILFKQERVGAIRRRHDGQLYWKKVTFACYKFRTMKIDADPSIHQAYIKSLIENDETQMTALQGAPTKHRKLVNDPRITRHGKLLRKLSIDELPQLWNVLLGDMSLVGPRPAIPYEVELYKLSHFRRLEAQPGITGLQQVMARSATDFDQQVRLDIDYIEKQSLWLDVKIMVNTVWAVVSTRGAH
jgi:lipopolysaccharide/colanic/teichoic acid biosynthesis glycosyltransferase